ncbi:MAG: glycosyltransferase family 4 protein, partial [Pseudomonadota bacterium]|nr:glycosyltransferase family 4 protein [Pseudomonadota bacterium]
GTFNVSRIIFVTADNPTDVSKLSGTLYYVYAALQRNPHGGITHVRGGLALLDLAARAFNKCLRKLGIALDCRFSTAYAVLAGLYLTARLQFAPDGTLLALVGSNYMAYVKTTRKLIYISDATFQAIQKSHPKVQAFPGWLKRQGHRNEGKILARTTSVIYSSRWAADSARLDYRVPSGKIFELPFGPNIPDDLINLTYSRKSIGSEVAILFVSADWDGKNGDIVISVCRRMIDSGIKTRLILVCEAPEHARNLEFVTYLGFLRKSDHIQMVRFCRAYVEAHFLLLPSIADATPIVFSEAQAFGVVSIAYDVGGVSSAVLHGHTGSVLPPEATDTALAAEILRYVRKPLLYQLTSERCRNRYLDEANWTRWTALIWQLAE